MSVTKTDKEVRFIQTTSADYAAQTEIISDAIYFLTDTKEIYVGSTKYSQSVNLKNGTGANSIMMLSSKEASGDASHAEGFNTGAVGGASHAEGFYTTASGDASHAEGFITGAACDGSHAEGSGTRAGQHAFQVNNLTPGEGTTGTLTLSSVEGLAVGKRYSAIVEGKFIFDCGEITAVNTDNTEIVVDSYPDIMYTELQQSSILICIVDDPLLGDRIIGGGAHAEGAGTTASGDASHAEGLRTKAYGNYSHAEGLETVASGVDSHAEGYSTAAEGNDSHAEGQHTTASEDFSHAEGAGTTASGVASHAEGGGTTASSDASHAEGGGTTASGPGSHAEGGGTTASGPGSHAEGAGTTASGDASHAEGDSTTASGPGSHAEGDSTTASGPGSHAEGSDTVASGYYSHAEGQYTTASGNRSHAEGFHTTASSNYSHVQGQFNVEDSSNTYADIIGNGLAENSRSNAHTVDWSGNAWYAGDVYVGSTSGTNKDEGSKKLATEEYVDLTSVSIDSTLTQPGQAADAATVGDRLSALSEEKVTMPVDAGGTAQNGISGQILQSNGDGTTQWVDKPTGGSSSGITDINIKKWFGKKIVVDGSSITAGGSGNTLPTWHSFLKDMFALDTVYNHSLSGSGWFIGGTTTTMNRVADYEDDADAVILMGDYNGIYNYTRGLGTIDDEPSLDGMCYARLKYLAETLINKYPLCPIIWVIEPPRAGVGETAGSMVPMNPGSDYNKYSAVIEEVAEYYGFTHCNLMKNTIFRPWIQANFDATTSDGTHPWNNIQRTMAQVIAETMKRTTLIYNESYVVPPDYSGGGDDSGGGTTDVTLTKITASANSEYTLFESDTSDTVKSCIRVVATYSDLSEKAVTDYTVTGEMVAGTQTFTVTYGGLTTTVSLTVTAGYRTVTITGTDYIDEELLGKYFDGNGLPNNTRDGMFVSVYIPVMGGTSITFSGIKLHGLTNHDVAFYDASYGFISTFNITSVASGKTTTVPENAAYFRFADDTSSTNTITYVPG